MVISFINTVFIATIIKVTIVTLLAFGGFYLLLMKQPKWEDMMGKLTKTHDLEVSKGTIMAVRVVGLLAILLAIWLLLIFFVIKETA